MTRRNLLLYLLQQAGERGLTTAEILTGGVGSRYGARLMELRAEGHTITATRIREGSWRYVLSTETGEVEQSPSSSASPDCVETLFITPKSSKTRSAVTGEWIPDEAA